MSEKQAVAQEDCVFRQAKVEELATDLTSYVLKWVKDKECLHPGEVSVAFNLAFTTLVRLFSKLSKELQ